MRNAFFKALHEVMARDDRVYFLTTDTGIVAFDVIKDAFPDRFLNVGIAETNAIGMAAGLASCGKVPFVLGIVPFVVLRCLEQLKVDVCLHTLDVKIVGIGCGLSYGSQGPTHHSTDDLAVTRALPGMTILSPADSVEAAACSEMAYRQPGPVYLRLGRGNEPAIYGDGFVFKPFSINVIRGGSDAAILATGPLVGDAMKAAHILKNVGGLDVSVVDVHTIKPLDEASILSLATNVGCLVTVEEHSIIGGLGSAVAEILAEKCEKKVPFIRLGVPDAFCCQNGTPEEIKAELGLTDVGIANAVRTLLPAKHEARGSL